MEEERIDKLEKEINDLKKRLCEDKPKKEKKHKEPSEYNKFVKDFVAKKKLELGDSYKHKEVFKAAANAWSEKKISK